MNQTKIELKKSKNKIPECAKCVFSGILFDVYHWKQEMFDGTYETFEAIKRKPTVQIIALSPNNKIILLNEEQPYVGKFISVPGGQVEKEDTPEETVHKELLEELGVKTDEIKYWTTIGLGSKIQWEGHYYIAKNCIKVQEQELESGEKIEPYEVSFEQFLEESQKDEFRNKALSDLIFKIMKDSDKLEEFKNLLFN